MTRRERIAIALALFALAAVVALLGYLHQPSADQRIAHAMTIKQSDPAIARSARPQDDVPVSSSLTVHPDGCPINFDGLHQTAQASQAYGENGGDFIGLQRFVESLVTVWRTQHEAHSAYLRIKNLDVRRCVDAAQERELRNLYGSGSVFTGHLVTWPVLFPTVGDESELQQTRWPGGPTSSTHTLYFRVGRAVAILWGDTTVNRQSLLRLGRVIAARGRQAQAHGA